jgi:multidrug efflux pump subunit AcrA (membrane-fusion protein)
MHSTPRRSRTLAAILVLAVLGGGTVALVYGRAWSSADPSDPGLRPSGDAGTATVARRDFVRALRLNGTVEAVQSTTIATPRLAGPGNASLIITRLVKGGQKVAKGDLIVEFDRQTQIAAALDKRAELNDLEQQIRKREAAEAAARAKDDSEILLAETTVARSKLEILKNEMLSKIQAEKNLQALEQAEATLTQLRATYDLKRKAAAADLAILKIRRARAGNAMRQAEDNADRMAVLSPLEGMAVIRMVWKADKQAEVQEGEEVRAGVPVVDIVNPEIMRVRARVNQADVNDLRVGQRVRVGLDAYPDLFFDGRIAQVSPIGLLSTLSPKVRVYAVLVDISGTHAKLMPDLTASLDVELSRTPGALVVPRDALRHGKDGVTVQVQRGSSYEERPVRVRELNFHEAAVEGLDEGAVVARHAARGAR